MKIKILILILVILVSINYASAANVCCEKTKTGEYCQNTDSSNCETGLKDPNDISNPTMSLEDLSERVSGFYTSDLNALVKQNLIEFCGGVRITGTGCIYYLKFTLSV